MAQDYGWQSYWWLSTAISALTNVWILFFQPETRWDRRAVAALPINDDCGGADIASSKNEVADITIERNETSVTTDEDGRLGCQLTGKPNKAQLMPMGKWQAHESVIAAVWLPIKMIKLPIVIWGALQFTFCASCFLMVNITQSQALGAPPFNFNPASVGYTNLALFIGTSFSLVTAGPFSDWISNRATMRNGGIREPEMRLPALLPFAVCAIVGCVVTALGFQYGWPWEVVVIIGFGLIGVQVAAISSIVINYVVSISVSGESARPLCSLILSSFQIDCYKPSAGEYLVCATVVKNVWGYGMTRFLNGWIVEIGYVGPLLTIMALNLGCLLIGAIPLYFYGKQVRGWSAKSSIHQVS
jgi:hypothetical protein